MNNILVVEGGNLSSPGVRILKLDSSVNQQTWSVNNHHNHADMQSSMNWIDDDQSLVFMKTKILNPNKSYTMSFGTRKTDMPIHDQNMSDEDEPSFMEDGPKGRKGLSPWQRMKWTDSRVRLLIQVVACVGDDGTLDNMQGGMKRKSGCLQKKGKWKTVSKIMITKGCQVSPQQCEDKFNDLNKRYKRLNDILGRGTSCRVVENPSLMDSMPQLSSKMKEDVKKILSSKHLFYPEMCAYHNGQRIPNCTELDLQVQDLPSTGQCSKENNHSSEAEEADDSEDDDSDREDEDHNNGGEAGERKKVIEDGFHDEMDEFFQDPNNSKLQKREWVKKRMLHLQEQRVCIEAEAFEMEKRRFKWQRFCDKKDRELEISRLENERLMLENERMTLQVKHKVQVITSE